MDEFLRIRQIYSDNKDKKFEDWLEYEKRLPSGKNGIVGILRIKHTKFRVVFKFSDRVNYLVKHESVIGESVNQFAGYCRHFAKTIGMINVPINTEIHKKSNPFDISMCKYPVNTDVLLIEYIQNSTKLYSMVKNKTFNECIIYSCIKQILLSLCIAQKEVEFTHYDLHSNNILVKKCDDDLAFLYVLDEENQFLVPTFGYYPVIIDYGFSHSKGMNDIPLWGTLLFTNSGFSTYKYSWFSDAKLFLVSMLDDLKYFRNSKDTKRFGLYVNKIFRKLDINWETGWDISERHDSVLNAVENILHPMLKSSKFFRENTLDCLEIIQSMVIIPVEKQDTSDTKKIMSVFLSEWLKIEEMILSDKTRLLALKIVCDTARRVRACYYDQECRNEALLEFKSCLLQELQSLGKYINPRNLNYEKLLCSFLILSRKIEGILYQEIEKENSQFLLLEDSIPLTSTCQIYAGVDFSVKSEYTYSSSTKILVIDNLEKKNYIVVLEKEHPKEYYDSIINSLNTCKDLYKGTIIYDYIIKKV